MFHYDPEYEEDGTVMLWFNCKTCKKMWKETYAIHKIEVIPEDYDSI